MSKKHLNSIFYLTIQINDNTFVRVSKMRLKRFPKKLTVLLRFRIHVLLFNLKFLVIIILIFTDCINKNYSILLKPIKYDEKLFCPLP